MGYCFPEILKTFDIYGVTCVPGKPNGRHYCSQVLNVHDQRCLDRIVCGNRKVTLGQITFTFNARGTNVWYDPISHCSFELIVCSANLKEAMNPSC